MIYLFHILFTYFNKYFRRISYPLIPPSTPVDTYSSTPFFPHCLSSFFLPFLNPTTVPKISLEQCPPTYSLFLYSMPAPSHGSFQLIIYRLLCIGSIFLKILFQSSLLYLQLLFIITIWFFPFLSSNYQKKLSIYITFSVQLSLN